MDQYYYEEGYIDAKYYVYVAEAIVPVGPFIEEGYIDVNYFEDYSVQSSLSCIAQIVVGQEVIAQGSWSSPASLTIAVSKLVQASSSLSVNTQSTVIGSLTREIDLYAFGEAAIAAQVQRIRDNNLAVSAVFSVAIDATRVRYIDSAEDALFDFDVINERSRGFNLETQAAFSLSVTVDNLIKEASATLLSEFTQQSAGGFTFEYSANLNVYSSILVSRNIGILKQRPLTPIQTGTINFDTDVKQIGTASARLARNSVVEYLSKNFASETITGRFWFRFNSSATAFQNVFYVNNDVTGAGDRTIISIQKDTSNQLIVSWYRNDLTYQSRTTTAISSNTWHHLAFLYDVPNKRIRFNINGSSTIDVTEPSLYWANNDKLIGINSSSSVSSLIYYDEIQIVNGTDMSVHNSRLSNNESTIFLGHFDNNLFDDVTLTQNINANLTSLISLSAKISGPVKLQSSLQSTANLSCTISHIEGADLSAFADAALAVDYIRIKDLSAAVETTTDLSVDVNVVTDAISTQSSEFTQSTDISRTRDNSIATESVATQLTAVVRLAGLLSDDISVFNLSSQPVKTVDINSTQSSEFTQSSTETRVRFNTADINSSFEITIQPFVGVVGASNEFSEFTLSCNASRTRDHNSTISSEFTVYAFANNLGKIEGTLFDAASMSIVVQKTTDITLVLDNQITLTTQTNNSLTRDFVSTETSQFDITINAVKNIGTFAFLEAFAANLTAAVKTGEFVIAADVVSAMSVSAVKTASAQSNFENQITQNANAVKTAVTGSIQAIEFSESVTAITVLQAHADFEAIASNLTAAVKIGDFFVNADVVADIDATAQVQRSAQSAINAQATLANTISKFTGFSVSVNVSASVITSPTKVVSSSVTIASAMTFVSEVREIHIEEIVYVIPAEIWDYEIYPETREYSIGSETREYIIT